ncbi:hypothetical protein SB6413_05602 [Klebsiella pasteurii]|uniref:Uncharacterized protein n=1 Tax=Klebsiella pneumoniae TaxID=573 RepID=A0A6M6A3E4_KLEPN|nr:hypothetical protein [Klebsiella pneumoniae]SYD77819.1 Uncharacterised protein [Klebsiella pneumoniae]VUT09103.1 hypothetical protein SB6413_05602 [Klebsiella pasteurii]
MPASPEANVVSKEKSLNKTLYTINIVSSEKINIAILLVNNDAPPSNKEAIVVSF